MCRSYARQLCAVMFGKQLTNQKPVKAFRQSALTQWEPEVIDPICEQLVDEFKNDGEADLIKAMTFEFPTRVTAALLGLPAVRGPFDWRTP